MVNVPVSPVVLKWAREERRITPEAAAEAVGMTLDELLEMESGAPELTIGALEKLARAYQIPLATLLMPDVLPQSTRPIIKDFRTIAGDDPRLSEETQLVVEEVYAMVEDFGELRESAPDLFGGDSLRKYQITDSPISAAKDVRADFNVPVNAQLAWQGDREAFFRWRQLIEAQGIFVLQQKMKLADCRGFSIHDERKIPVIVLNSAESDYKYRTFSLWHEYAHLMLRQAGLSDENRSNRVERFCNQFAAYFLMPVKEFKEIAVAVVPKGERWGEYQVGRLANLFKVSKSCIIYHLEDTGIVPEGSLAWLRAELSVRRSAKSTGGRASHVEKIANRLGARPVELVLSALRRGTINKIDAYELLDVRPAYFSDLTSEIAKRKAAFGGGG